MLNRRRRAHRTQPWSEVIIGSLLSVAAIVATQSQSQRRVNILIPAELAMGNAKSIIPAVVVFLRLGVKEVEILPGMGRYPTRSYLLPPPRPWTPSRPPHQCRPWRRVDSTVLNTEVKLLTELRGRDLCVLYAACRRLDRIPGG